MTLPPKSFHAHSKISFNDKDKTHLRQEFYPTATDQQIDLFLSICEKKQLDPFTRQIYMKLNFDNKTNRNRMNIVTTIDGLRLTAERSGKYAGQVGPFWCDKDGKWVDVWLLDGKQPVASKVGVLRHDFKESMFGVANFDSYVQTDRNGLPTMIWKKMGPLMIAKCAEALALRKAFPEEMSGLYTEDEMGIEPEVEKKDQAPPAATSLPPEVSNLRKDLMGKIIGAAGDMGWTRDHLLSLVNQDYKKVSFELLSELELEGIFNTVSNFEPSTIFES